MKKEYGEKLDGFKNEKFLPKYRETASRSMHVTLPLTKNIDAIFYDLKNEGIQKKTTQHKKKSLKNNDRWYFRTNTKKIVARMNRAHSMRYQSYVVDRGQCIGKICKSHKLRRTSFAVNNNNIWSCMRFQSNGYEALCVVHGRTWNIIYSVSGGHVQAKFTSPRVDAKKKWETERR